MGQLKTNATFVPISQRYYMKKVISVIVCLFILMGIVPTVMAAEEKTAFVVISGMNSYPLCDENGEQIYPLTTSSITQMVGKLISPILSFITDKDSDKLADEIIPVVYDSFAPIACDEAGESKNSVITREYKTDVADSVNDFIGEETDELAIVRRGIEVFGADNTYFFNYDWRLDPLNHADKLNELIKTIKQTTDCTRIALSAFSMGGTVVCSYLYKYGSHDIDSITLCSTAFQGTSGMGSVFSGDLEVSMDGLINRLAQLTKSNFFENLIKYLNIQLSLSGINTGIEEFANDLTSEVKLRVYSELLIPIFGYMPGLWALVDDDNFTQSKSVMLGDNPNSELLQRIDDYHYNVQCKAAEIFNKAQTNTDIYIVAQYNMQGLPISETSTSSNNDYLIDTKYASGGAVCALLGETLPEEYVQQQFNEYNYISPDKQIDASTCMLPACTWFIRDMGHVDYPYGQAADFVIYLAQNSELTVFDSEYPQFMSYSYATNSLSAVETVEELTFSDRFFNLLTKILTSFFSAFDSLFNMFKTGVC